MKTAMISINGIEYNLYGLILFIMLITFLVLIIFAHRKKKLDWVDMITRDGRTVSTTKILQLVGGIVATWVIIKTTLLGTMTWDLFAIYLAYVASIDGYSKLLIAKYSNGSNMNSFNGYQQQTFLQTPVQPIKQNSSDLDVGTGAAKAPDIDDTQ